MSTNRQWQLAQRPTGDIDANTFRLCDTAIPECDESKQEVLLKTLYLSFEAAMRGWLDDRRSYMPPVDIGEPMRAAGVAQVVASGNKDFPVGSLVMGMTGWQEYLCFSLDETADWKVLPEGTPPNLPLSIFGGTSMTAYFGLLEIGQPKAGETVLVSGAAGATGSIVCQIAKMQGCRVIGIAGGSEKCDWLLSNNCVDEVIDYKSQDIHQRLTETCPDDIDVYFDNVGGSTLEIVLEHMADFGRIAMCGSIAGYNDAEPSPGPNNLSIITTRRLRVQGFILFDFLERAPECIEQLTEWVMSGKLQWREDIQEGFENIPATLTRLYAGKNQGKQLLKLADPA